MNEVKIGSIVKWSSSKKPIGRVIHIFSYNLKHYAVVDTESHRGLIVCHIYDKLQVVR